MMRPLLQDLRYAARQLAHTRGFTAVAVITLALGIGGNTVFFAAVNAMIFRPLRATHVDGLFFVNFANKRLGSHAPLTAQQVRRLEADQPGVIARMGAVASFSFPLVAAVPSRAERLDAEVVTSGYALTLNLAPQAGRMFNAADDVAGASPTAIISDRLWREWFESDHAATDRGTIRLNGVPFSIVGVMPRGYQGLYGPMGGATDLWIPAAVAYRASSELIATRKYWLTLVRPQSVAARVQAETAIRAVLTSAPDDPDPAFIQVRLFPMSQFLGQNRLADVGMTVIAFSGLLLLAACANVAHMLFARGTQRAGEVAVRLSLGASRAQIFRLFLLESALVAGMAATLGLTLAIGATSLIGAAFPAFRFVNFRLFVDLTPDYRVFLFAFGAGAVATIGVGVAAAWRASGAPPLRALAASGVPTGATRRGRGLRLGMVTLQIAAAVVLLMGAGLYLRMTEDALDRYVVFDTTPIATARVDLRLHGYHEARGREFFRTLLDDLRALPGVERAALTDGFPAGAYAAARKVQVVAGKELVMPDGAVRRIDGSQLKLDAGYAGVSAGFLDTVGLPLRQGRDISAVDDDGTPLVAVVSESVAQLLWPGQDAIGKTLMFGNDGRWRTVVGVCGDPVAARVESPFVSPANFVLIPAAQSYRPDMLLVVRARAPHLQLEPIRSAIRAIDGNVAPFDVATADRSIMAWAAPLHAATLLTAALGLLALTIATLGIYGVVAYVVSLRTREFGIRMALGAKPSQVVKLVADEAVYLLLVGLLAGVLVTSVAERYFQSRRVLFMPNEISTWAAVLFSIMIVGVVAACVPARRASRIDPNVALREL